MAKSQLTLLTAAESIVRWAIRYTVLLMSDPDNTVYQPIIRFLPISLYEHEAVPYEIRRLQPRLTAEGRAWLTCWNADWEDELETTETRETASTISAQRWVARRLIYWPPAAHYIITSSQLWWAVLCTSSPLGGLYEQPSEQFIAAIREVVGFPAVVPDKPQPPVIPRRRLY